MSGSRRSSTTQSYSRSCIAASASCAGADRRDVHVVVRDQLLDAHALGRIVLDDEQLPRPRLGEALDAVERRFDAVGRQRLVEIRERAALEPVLALLLDRADLHRDVARRRVLLQLREHRPAEHVGQEDVERHRGRLVLARERERFGAAHRDEPLEAVVAREREQRARVVRIVLRDEQHGVARLEVLAVVRDLLDARRRQHDRLEALGDRRSAAPRSSLPEAGPTYLTGRYSVNVLPTPGIDESLISPPSRLASSRLIARPRPVPPYLRDVPASACWNASKMIFCFSGGMPMPLSVTVKRTTRVRLATAPGDPATSPTVAGATSSRTPPWSVNLNAFESRFFSTCSRRFGSVVIAVDASAGSNSLLNMSLRASATWPKLRCTSSRRCENGSSSHSTVTVPDSIFERSRMSLIRFRRSVPAPWIVCANSTWRLGEVAVGVLGELLAEDQDRVQRRAQLVRHVRQELRLVARGERELGGFLFHRAAGLVDLLVLALDLGVLRGEQPRFLRELVVGLLQLFLLRLQLGGELLRLLEQALGAHRRFDRVQHDADRARELLEEREVRGGEVGERGELDHRLHLAFEQHRQHDHVARPRGQEPARDLDRAVVDVGEHEPLLLDRALADETFADAIAARARRLRGCPRSRRAASGSGRRLRASMMYMTPWCAFTSGTSSESSVCATVKRSRWPCIIRLNLARLVFSQSCSVLRSVVARRLPIIALM